MTHTALSVVVRVPDQGGLTPTIAALDVQTAPTDQWELVLVATGAQARRQAEGYREFRPNVAVSAPGDEAAVASGTWVWEVGAGDVLPRTAIARVIKAIGSGSGAPIVGRAVSKERQESDWLFQGAKTLSGSRALLALTQPAVIVPRSLWSPADDASGYPRFACAATILETAGSVDLLAGGAVLVGHGPQGKATDAERMRALVGALDGRDPDLVADTVRTELTRQSWRIDADTEPGAQALAARIPQQTLPVRLATDGRFEDAKALREAISQIAWEIHAVEAKWDAGTLQLSGSATLAAPAALTQRLEGAELDDLGAPRPRLGLRNRPTTSTIPVPTTAEVETTEAGWRVSFRAELPLEGWVGALPDGAYQLVIEAPGLPGNPLLVMRRDGLHLPAVVGNRLATLRHETKTGLHFDLGAAQQSLLRRLDPAGAHIQESMDGSALTWPAPPIHVWPPERAADELRGRLLLGGLAFPASLQLDPPTVRCLVSGMPGALAIQTRFGKGKATQTGCELRVSPSGEYAVGPLTTAETSGISTLVASGTSPKRGVSKQAPKAGAAKTAAPATGDTSPLQAAWRRLPTPVKDRLRGPAKRLTGR